MKMECDIIRDLMPLYAENMVSEKSRKAVDSHLAECAECKNIYVEMTSPKIPVQFNTEPAKSFQRYMQKEKRRVGVKVALISIGVVLAAILIRFLLFGATVGFLAFDMKNAKIEEDTDISHYRQYIGTDADDRYCSKLGMDESIFPEDITPDMNVTDYKMVYYNPWDPQWLSYVVAEYDDAAYHAEIERLSSYPSDEYQGIYGAQDFHEDYELLAIDADPSYGFVYALTDGDRKIIYVEIIFCNYFMDLDYGSYIDASYLPTGFDATTGNPYREKIMSEHDPYKIF